MLCRQNCSPTLTNCTIIGNSSLSGAGLHCTVNSSPMLTNCRLTGNLALNAGALLCDENSAPTLTNCTIMENESGAIECTILSLTNCIVWDNFGLSIRSADPSLVTVTYSCIEGAGVWPGEGNINKNPLILGSGFWDTNGSPLDLFEWEWIDGDYHLQPDSPCIDTGTSLLAPAVDLDDFGRPCGAGVDMGAYESGDCPPPTRFKRGDANADGNQNLTDAVFVLNHLFGGGDEPTCAKSADVNDSGAVDLTDPVFLLNFLFLGRLPSPPAPFAECGPDPTVDDLTCESFEGCE